MQIGISIEPYLVLEKVEIIQYIDKIVALSRKLKHGGHTDICLHFDYFKPNPAIFRLVQSYARQIEIDLHLMQEPAPSLYGFRSVSFDVKDLSATKAQKLANADLVKNIQAIDEQRCGLVLDLGCDINSYEALIRQAHFITVMTVKCGQSGQVFQTSALELLDKIRVLNPAAVITVDGGVNANNCLLLKERHVDVAVVGSYAQKCDANGTFEIGINRLLHD